MFLFGEATEFEVFRKVLDVLTPLQLKLLLKTFLKPDVAWKLLVIPVEYDQSFRRYRLRAKRWDEHDERARDYDERESNSQRVLARFH